MQLKRPKLTCWSKLFEVGLLWMQCCTVYVLYRPFPYFQTLCVVCGERSLSLIVIEQTLRHAPTSVQSTKLPSCASSISPACWERGFSPSLIGLFPYLSSFCQLLICSYSNSAIENMDIHLCAVVSSYAVCAMCALCVTMRRQTLHYILTYILAFAFFLFVF